jgi:uroporphyrinogen-III synthase
LTTIAILRTKDRKEESVQLAQEMGFEVRFASPLELSELDTPRFGMFTDQVEAGKVSRVIITSSTAVMYLMRLLNKKGNASKVVKRLNEKGVIAIGPTTAEALKREWIKVEVIPEKFTSEGLVDHLHEGIGTGDVVWLVRSDKGSQVILQGLERTGAKVEEVAVYSLVKSEPDRAMLDMYFWTVKEGIDVFAFTSSMMAESFIQEGERKYGVRQFGTALNASLIAAIGESTRRTLEDMGINVDVMPEKATFSDMMVAIRNYIDRKD